jgi:hypothetical protein
VEADGQRIADGGWPLYLAAQGLKDDRWRYQSPSRIARFYGNLRWKGTEAEVHLVAGEEQFLWRDRPVILVSGRFKLGGGSLD